MFTASSNYRKTVGFSYRLGNGMVNYILQLLPCRTGVAWKKHPLGESRVYRLDPFIWSGICVDYVTLAYTQPHEVSIVKKLYIMNDGSVVRLRGIKDSKRSKV